MYHFQSSVTDWPRAVSLLPDGALVKSVDRGDILRDVKLINPNITTALRHWGGTQNIFDGRGFEAYKQLARQFFSEWIDETFRTQYARYTDIVVEWNEYLASSHTGTELQDRIDWARAVAWVWRNEYRTQADYSHIRLALLSCPVGNDIHRAFAEIALQYDCVLSYHAYDKHINGTRDPLSWRYHCGRWAYMEQSWGLKPDWMFGEAGPYSGVENGWRHSSVLGGNQQAYVDAVRTWIREIKQTPAYAEGRVLGFNLFTTGGGDTWKQYETRQPEMDALSVMIAQEWKPVALPAPPPPPDNIPLPDGIIDVVDELPMNPESKDWPYATRPLSAIENIVIHHSAGQPTNPPESIAIGHINRDGGGADGWPGIGYHFYINLDSNGAARIYNTNYLTTHSYHVGDDNRESLGICIAGNFVSEHPSPAQLDAARYLLSWLFDIVPGAALNKHLDFMSTRCPGDTWPEWWPQLTEEPVEERKYKRVYHLLPQDATVEEMALVMALAYQNRQTVGYSADDAFSKPPEVTARTVYVWDAHRFPGGKAGLQKWVSVNYPPVPANVFYRSFAELFPPTVTAPVGTEEERAAGIWPQNWTDANPYGNRYLLRGQWVYHCGADLNKNTPAWDSDRHAPVWAVAAGVVTYADYFNGAWGPIVVIRHDLPDGTHYSRSAHLHTMDVVKGERVKAGQLIGLIGGEEVGLPNHLHLDISDTEALKNNPGDWPGGDLTRVHRDYLDPKSFLEERV